MSKKYKILFVAVFNPNSTNVSQSDGFKKNGCDVIEFNYRSVAARLGNYERDSLIIKTCKDQKPDAVVFSKCNEVNIRVVNECNKVCKTILWYQDPFNGNFNQELIDKIKNCSFTLCGLTEPFNEAKKIGGDKVFFLQEGFDHTCNHPIDTPYKYEYSFIGNPRGWRMKYVKALNIPVIQDAYGKKHSNVVSQTKINLNFTEGGTSDRTYKVLASKGFLLTEPWDGMDKDFIDGVDLVTFKNIEDLKNKIDYYLKNDDLRDKIRSNGYESVLKFDRITWARKIINLI